MTPSENVREQILSSLQKQVPNPALAAEYSRLCRDLNRRLEQIEEVMDQGDEIQAIQMAEIYPPVMDEADTLSFFKSREWNALCEKNAITSAPEIRAQGIAQLNTLYGKGVGSSHPIYKEYREAILARDDDKALQIAKTIESLNPGDSGAREESSRLEKKVLSNIITELRSTLSLQDVTHSILLLEKAEQMNLPELLDSSPEVASARNLRDKRDASQALADILSMLSRLEELRAQDDWRSVSESVARIDSLRSRHGIELDALQQSSLENATVYSEKKRAQAVKETEFRLALNQFLICFDDASSRTQARGTLSISEIRDLLTRLNKEWQSVESFGMPVDSGRIEEASHLVEMLRNDLDRLQKKRTLAIASLALAALVLIIVSGWWILMQYRAGDMTKELIRCREARSLASIQKLVADASASNLPLYSSKLSAEVEGCRKWMQSVENECRTSSEALANLLKRCDSLDKEEPVALDGEYQSLIKRVKELPDEQNKAMQPDIMKLEKTYGDHLASLGASNDKVLQGELDAFDNLSKALQKTGISLKEIKENLAEQKAAALKWEPLVHSTIKDLPISSSLKANAEAGEENIKSLSLSVETIDATLHAMSQATKVDLFRESLKTLKEIPLPNCQLITDARIAWNTEFSADSLLPELLFPGNPGAYEALKKDPSVDGQAGRLYPKSILPTEVAPFSSLLNDEMTQDMKIFFIEGGDPSRKIYSKSGIKTLIEDPEDSVFGGTIYDPAQDSSMAPSLSFKKYRAKSKGWEKAKKISGGGDVAASKIYRDLALKDVVSDSMEVKVSILQLLDRLTKSESKDPVYEAFVIQQLLLMKKARPFAWGTQYSPSAENFMREVDQTVRVNCGTLPTGAWLAPYYEKLADQLKPLLNKAPLFNGEAELNKMLAEQLVGQDALRYAGYVSEDGKPCLSPDIPIPTSDLFGLSGTPDARRVACVFRISRGTDNPVYTREAKPVPLTPLYQLQKGKENLLESGIKELRLDNVRSQLSLPPLFASPPSAQNKP